MRSPNKIYIMSMTDASAILKKALRVGFRQTGHDFKLQSGDQTLEVERSVSLSNKFATKYYTPSLSGLYEAAYQFQINPVERDDFVQNNSLDGEGVNIERNLQLFERYIDAFQAMPKSTILVDCRSLDIFMNYDKPGKNNPMRKLYNMLHEPGIFTQRAELDGPNGVLSGIEAVVRHIL